MPVRVPGPCSQRRPFPWRPAACSGSARVRGPGPGRRGSARDPHRAPRSPAAGAALYFFILVGEGGVISLGDDYLSRKFVPINISVPGSCFKCLGGGGTGGKFKAAGEGAAAHCRLSSAGLGRRAQGQPGRLPDTSPPWGTGAAMTPLGDAHEAGGCPRREAAPEAARRLRARAQLALLVGSGAGGGAERATRPPEVGGGWVRVGGASR